MVLEDPEHNFSAGNIVPLVNRERSRINDVLDAVGGKLTTAGLAELVQRCPATCGPRPGPRGNGCGQRFRSPSAAVGTTLDLLDDVSKVRHGATAADRLTLEVPNGMLTVFVGPSGCGKTTALANDQPNGGLVRAPSSVDGTDVSTVNAVNCAWELRHPERGADASSRVIDNVATVPVLKGQPRRAARKPVMRCLSVSGWTPLPPATRPSSGGECNGVGVARALAADPPMLLDGRVTGRRPGGSPRATERNTLARKPSCTDHCS